MLSYYVSLHSVFRVVMSIAISDEPLYLQLFVRGLMSYLCYLCLFAYSGVQHILCSGFFFSLHLVYTMLSVSLCCVFSLFILCTLCCQFLCVVFFLSSSCVHYVVSFSVLCFFSLHLVYTMLSVSLCCVFSLFILCTLCCQFLCVVFFLSSSCVHYVVSFSWLSIIDCPLVFSYVYCICITSVWEITLHFQFFN